MKKFQEMSQAEIDELTDEEFKSISPFEKKSCADCSNITTVLSMWCNDINAIKERGTRVPGCIKCPYWKPDWDKIDSIHKTSENGYNEKVNIVPVLGEVVSTEKWYEKLISFFK